MELKARGYKATYLCQYIAVGEAPEEARNIFQQRSRWTKGHYQVRHRRRPREGEGQKGGRNEAE